MTAEKVKKFLENCAVCPRNCRVNRNQCKTGFCGAGGKVEVYSAHLHFGEEPPISGQNGSGTIFFAHCSLRCVYCQNYKLSQIGHGKEFDTEELAGLMLSLERQKAHNINLVTPTHYAPQIALAVIAAKERGLAAPIVYNTSGYESVDTLRFLDGLVDIYLADMRYGDNADALKYSACPDYVEKNQEAVLEMYGQVGKLKIGKDGAAEKGVIIRHLILPRNINGQERVLKFIAQNLGRDAHISLMSQYYPAYNAFRHSEISRRINKDEHDSALAVLEKYRLRNGWIQEYMGVVDDGFAGTNIAPDV